MRQRVRAMVNRVRGSLFYVPAGFVVVSVAVAVAVTQIPAPMPMSMADSPEVASSRVILTTIAGATITVAGIVFSITLVALQLSAIQFFARVLQGFLRDRFSQVVVGLVVGTFTYSMVVLALLRRTSESGVAVALAVLLAIVVVLAIIAFIDRSARWVQAGYTIQRISPETRDRIDDLLPYAAEQAPPTPLDERGMPDGESDTVRSTHDGWLQRIDEQALAGADQPEVCIALLRTIARLHDKLTASELSERTPPLQRQAELVVEGADQACRLPEDRDRVRQAAADLGYWRAPGNGSCLVRRGCDLSPWCCRVTLPVLWSLVQALPALEGRGEGTVHGG